ncbi:hypothetical protein [Streptomyces acidiscabies]|uniref:Uncharacterized protein n=1 Tax=Streptomyces acidiscabies TaxID=42234 RepID=A0A0L0JKC1_9ACTN|nr:hypothetical protein [Streptomyces acidiscabies]KND26127.1 hypothetical protein IQ63_38495 [Streptomyces acidiscabies]
MHPDDHELIRAGDTGVLVRSSPHGTPCSSWTWRGRPLPYVPMDDTWERPAEDPVAVRGWYELSGRTFSHLLGVAAWPHVLATLRE